MTIRVRAEGVSVVVCCHNSTRRVRETLACLARQRAPGVPGWEVIVVDNASTDNLRDVVDQAWPDDAPAQLRIVTEPQLGLTFARRRGCREAHYIAMCYVDDDNRVAPGWVEEVYRIFTAHPDVAVAGGDSTAITDIEPPHWFQRFARAYAVGRQGDEEGDITGSVGLWGAGICLRTEALDELFSAGFSPLLTDRRGTALSAGGDYELCYALRLKGWRLWYSPKLQLQHSIPSARLDEAYLRRLFRGAGVADVWLDLYYSQLSAQPPSWLSLPHGTRWMHRTLRDVRELARHTGRCVHSGLMTRPCIDCLSIERVVARAHERWRHRSRWEVALDSLVHADWRG